MSLVLEMPPGALIDGVDLTDDTDSPYESEFIDLSDYRQYMLSFLVEAAPGGGAGEASVQLLLYDNKKATLLGTVDLLTAIPTDDDASELVTFGRGLTPFNVGAGTIGDDIAILKVMKWAKLQITVETESDATTCIGTARLYAGN